MHTDVKFCDRMFCDERKIVIFTDVHVTVELIVGHVNVLTKPCTSMPISSIILLT